MVMQPGKGRIWVAGTQTPSPQNPFFAFDLCNWQRLPEYDLPGNGYLSALACAYSFIDGNYEMARLELVNAMQKDQPSAILVIMQAVIESRLGHPMAADRLLRGIIDQWGQTPIGRLAENWLNESKDGDADPIPFPSAIKPLIYFKSGVSWLERVSLK